jgi:hypothetical protein
MPLTQHLPRQIGGLDLVPGQPHIPVLHPMHSCPPWSAGLLGPCGGGLRVQVSAVSVSLVSLVSACLSCVSAPGAVPQLFS